MTNPKPTIPFGAGNDIAEGMRRQNERQLAERLAAAADQRAREKRVADQRAQHGVPNVLGRLLVRQGSGSLLVELVDHSPVPIRVLLARDQTVEPVHITGMFRTLGLTILEHSGYAEPSARIWTLGTLDPTGGGSGPTPQELPPVGAPLFESEAAIDVEHEPSDEERAHALDAARETLAALGPTKARARDLAAALRHALELGPHAIEALALVLDEHGRPAGEPTPPTTTEPPRAA